MLDGLAVQALVVVLTQLCSPADGIGFGEGADIEHDGSLFLFCDKIKMRRVVKGFKPDTKQLWERACSR
jgi:hypothetical protein